MEKCIILSNCFALWKEKKPVNKFCFICLHDFFPERLESYICNRGSMKKLPLSINHIYCIYLWCDR